jgi:hypothetical protein
VGDHPLSVDCFQRRPVIHLLRLSTSSFLFDEVFQSISMEPGIRRFVRLWRGTQTEWHSVPDRTKASKGFRD